MSATEPRRAEITDSALSAEISRREDEWMAAWLRRDMQSASNILADEFTLTSSLSTGELMTKAQWLVITALRVPVITPLPHTLARRTTSTASTCASTGRRRWPTSGTTSRPPCAATTGAVIS
jgi:hypothetical protein